MILHSVFPSCRVKHLVLQFPCGCDGFLLLVAVLVQSGKRKSEIKSC